MASDYQAISVYNEEQLGKDRASRKSQVAMYTDPVHFIFELLQNADDACATKISFTVTPDQLIIEHNGKLFTESNVKAISYFEKSDKTESGEEITKIGHFGLGFKSVFAYTASPYVYSGQESFKITQLYSVEAVPYPISLKETQTRFVFPFDHLIEKPDYIENRKLKSPEIAYQDIAGKLEKLGADTLLFTKFLEEICWTSLDSNRHYRRKSISINSLTREVCINNGASEQRCYLVFDRPIFWPDDKMIEKQHRPVQIAFGLDKPRKDGGVIRKINNAQLFVFFPTTRETHVGFILQGPYRTNPPRENVFPDDEFNQHLGIQTAELLTESLHQLKELDLLNLNTLSVLPLHQDKFEGHEIFKPLYLQVCEALRTAQLLPKHQGGFASANESRLVRGAKLAEVFDAEQLGMLFGREKLEWLDTSLTINNYPDLHRFLTELVDGIEVSPDTLAPKLTTDFFSKQSSDWLIKFIQYAEKSTDKIKQCQFIRLESGEHVTLRQDDENATAWFAPENSTGLDLIKDFPLVHHKLAENEEVRKFLDKEGIHKIKSVDIVEQRILPKYQDTPFDVDTPFSEYEKAYRADLYQIGKAYADADDEIKEGLNKSLNDIEWLACFHASGNEPDKVFWKTPESTNLYAKPTEKLGFTVPEDKIAYFLHPVVSEALAEFKSINDYLKESIQPIAPLTIVKDFILPSYKIPSEFDEVSYRKDLQWICKAFSGDESVKDELKQSLSSPITWHPPTTWLACVHASGKEPEEIIWRKPKAGDLFAKSVDEQTFRVPENMNGYFLHPSVVDEFRKNESARMYLEKCVNEMDAIVIVEKFILPKYTNPDTKVDFDEALYRPDLQWIGKAYNSNKKYLIADKLKNTAWLACVHASGNHPDDVIWEKSDATRLFKSTETHCEWFTGLEDVDVYFLHPIVKKELNGIADDLISSIGKGELVIKQTPNYQSYVVISNQHGCHKRGLDGFDSNWEITGITQMLTKPRPEQSKILWNLLLINSKCIRGFTESSNRSNWSNIKKKEELSKIGNQLSTSKWLPDKAGIWHKPGELLLTDLPDEFDTGSLSAIKVADKLGMKTPEEEQAINIVAGDDSDLKRLIARYKSASDADRQKMLKIIPQEIPPQPAPSFKDGLNRLNRPQRGSIASNDTDNSGHPLTNPERYQNKVDQAVEEGIKQHESTPQTIRFSPVRESASNKPARDFLYAEYQGKCQITGNTFPKASANANGEAENYFEACSLLSYSNADYLNDAGNMLCVSADTMAKLKNASFEWLDDLEPIIERFKNREMENVKMKIKLAGEECVITWSERHSVRLVALYDKAS